MEKMAVAIKKEMRRREIDPTLIGMKPAHDLVPYIVSLWNHLKGGEDVFGRILKNSKIHFRSLSPFEYFVIRFIMVQILNAHMAYRIYVFLNVDRLRTRYHTTDSNSNSMSS